MTRSPGVFDHQLCIPISEGFGLGEIPRGWLDGLISLCKTALLMTFCSLKF